MTTERHPLEPFNPKDARILFLGSFPPPRKRWSMDFFYPNWINDFWRIMGLIYHGDRHRFEVPGEKRFDKERIESFCTEKGFALFDTATEVCRLKDNASDNFLEITEPTDITALLERMPHCDRIVTTGGKASEEFASTTGSKEIPPVGGHLHIQIAGRGIDWFRVPSSSRAFPMALEKKAAIFMEMLEFQQS
jgi:G:T/U mismatch-specific DNA glycosylase